MPLQLTLREAAGTLGVSRSRVGQLIKEHPDLLAGTNERGHMVVDARVLHRFALTRASAAPGNSKWAQHARTISAHRAIELITEYGLEATRETLDDARITGELAAVKLGCVYRFDELEIRRYADRQIARPK